MEMIVFLISLVIGIAFFALASFHANKAASLKHKLDYSLSQRTCAVGEEASDCLSEDRKQLLRVIIPHSIHEAVKKTGLLGILSLTSFAIAATALFLIIF